jgi:hypothetical protein
MSRWPNEEQPPVQAEEEPLDGEWELDPNDPTHPDYDLSLAHGYADWEPARKPWLTRRGVLLLFALLVILGLMLPVLVLIL